jgi:A/G-specific adenine glycosylase
LCRYFGIDGYPGEKQNETLLWRKAEELLPQYDGNQIDENQIEGPIEVYTQALMDLGATVCTRGKPKCHSCPLPFDCIAFRDNKVDRLPAPRPRKPLPEKETALLVLMKQGEILLEKRPVAGIWGGLWCLPEMPVSKNAAEYCMNLGMKVKPLVVELEAFDHTFTHFRLRIHPKPLEVVSYSSRLLPAGGDGSSSIWIAIDDALKTAIPSPVRKLLMQICCP